MSRFYVPKDSVRGREIHILGSEAHHIFDVLRLKENDPVCAFDGTGKEYLGTIKTASKRSVIIGISATEEARQEDHAEFVLVQAVPKKDRMDNIVEKATELGVRSIIPALTERTVVRLEGDRLKKRHQRWVRIAEQASQQCGRVKVPAIEKPISFRGALGIVKEMDLKLIACLEKDTKNIKDALAGFQGKGIALFIGPEGDFTGEEVSAAKAEGAVSVSLGPRVLKSDTAGIALLSILDYEIN
ncbi:16S rRNA (uracil(1498)-N(3))-methyltransferase [Candidatus Omnitrophota bacterium]